MNGAFSQRHDACSRVAELPTGQLRLDLEPSDHAVDDLLDFAARENPRRAFLFLSKVLGKHVPVRPHTMLETHRTLAASIPATGSPILFIGMAETATGLGQGVFEAYLAHHPHAPALYLHTTRYRVAGAERLDFEESHSHAPRVFLHLPTDPVMTERMRQATQVVLVDDELSTGNTFVNLVRVLGQVMPQLERVHLATLADFMGPARRVSIADDLGLPCSVGALIRGGWQFERNAVTVAAPAAQCAAGQEVHLKDAGHGRLGRCTALSLPGALVSRLAAEPVTGPTLVLGTGEFMHAAFVLGRALEQAGVETWVQATTRSPIMRWGGVRHVRAVPDPYHEGVPNFVYNLPPDHYARILVCHETPPDDTLLALAGMLQARLIHFQAHDHAEEVPVCRS